VSLPCVHHCVTAVNSTYSLISRQSHMGQYQECKQRYAFEGLIPCGHFNGGGGGGWGGGGWFKMRVELLLLHLSITRP